MKLESATDILTRDILLLKARRAGEMDALKEQVHVIYESIRPINLIKSTLKEATEMPDIKGNIGKAAIGMAAGYVLKKILFGPSINPLKNIAGAAFQTLITNVVAKNSDTIKEKSFIVFEMAKALIMPKKKVAKDANLSKY